MTEQELERLRRDVELATKAYVKARVKLAEDFPCEESLHTQQYVVAGIADEYFERLPSPRYEEEQDKVHRLYFKLLDAEKKLHEAIYPPQQQTNQPIEEQHEQTIKPHRGPRLEM